ncbi:hypothetical protein PCANC_28197 [Puccinia coronata f. sp. avenae]|uniref:Uncharacterized protein n=1 Tax=Puccinia coronata f. sp. avenae TaxID=200324 RepID=A0A2N5RXD6_9BASI|nr:hypothetical protein PCANC_28197 [Puccinia coronata f. sp. avenae]
MAVVLLARHWGGALVPQAQKRCKVAARDATCRIKLTPQKDKLVNDKVALSPQQKPSKKTAPTKALQRASTDIKGKRKIDTRLASDDKDKSSSSEELEHVMAQPIMPTEIAKDAPSGSRPRG